ncbi:hypothetical protein BDV96DRAFT_502378 [Lophiotrema nucula]|uniref:F-box domain-containing protein n=1 Tax=Lophiotrema nucula TaxID=690887 RepID=A0A6A5YRT4_9PLEO|nr:hypothetical protein BDV96DRAFT_502378 [Lophiotrema nucula]
MPSQGPIVPIYDGLSHSVQATPRFSNYLPDELLLEILNYIPKEPKSQGILAKFCLISRQWYDVGIRRLYESPHIAGRGYELFVRTVCPSINLHVRKSELAGLVKVLDLSYIIHHGNKATTARLLGRTKSSLEVFIAPQASFAVNCWASLSKCTHLKVLDLTLISESISYQALNQTCRQLHELTHLYFPRCSSDYNAMGLGNEIRWPPRLEHLGLAGNVHGKFLWDMLEAPHGFPPSLSSLCISHAPSVDSSSLRPLLNNLASMLKHVELRDLRSVRQGKLNNILHWLPHLERLTIATDYIDIAFGNMPEAFPSTPDPWKYSKPLQYLKLVNSGSYDTDPHMAFSPVDLFTLIDERFLGRLRVIEPAQSLNWHLDDDGAQIEVLETLMIDLDRENWSQRRWEYAGMRVREGMTYEQWCVGTGIGRKMRPRLRVLKDQ